MDEQQNMQPAQETYATQVPQPLATAPMMPPGTGKSGKGKKALKLILVLLLILAAAAGGYYLGRANKQSSAPVVTTKLVEQSTVTTATNGKDALAISTFGVTLPMTAPYNDLFYTPRTMTDGESVTISSASLKKIGKCQDYIGEVGTIAKITKADPNTPATNQVTIAKNIYVWTPTQNTCTSDQALEEAYRSSVAKNFINMKAAQ